MATITEATQTLELSALPRSKAPFKPRSAFETDGEPELTRSRSVGAVSTVSRVDATRKGTTAIIIACIAGTNIIGSMLAGIVTISLPTIAQDLHISPPLLIWPASIYSLSCGCTLILCGTIADVVGARLMYLVGTLMQTIFTLACGLSKTEGQIILFRGLAGIAISFCLPSAVSLIMAYFEAGPRRNLAFAIMGGGQPIGFTVGLVGGGAIADRVGWPIGFYGAAGLNTFLFVLAWWKMPKFESQGREKSAAEKLRRDIDWVGAGILTTSLAMLLYVFASWAGSLAEVSSPRSVVFLVAGLALLPAFAMWSNRQERMEKPVLIRNSLWRNKRFTSICLNVFLIWGAFNATEVFLTFLFQDVQGLSATSSSIRFLPEPVMGAVMNVVMGLFVHKIRADWTLTASFVLSALSPLLLAVSQAQTTYWGYVFPAIALLPVSADVLYTVSQLIITAEFDEKTQALAGGVFNTVAQIGKSVGLAISAVVANGVTARLDSHVGTPQQRLLTGYRATWWYTMACTVTCILVTFWGLRGIGKVGLKRD